MRAKRKSKKTSKLSLVLIWGLLLQLFVQPLAAPAVHAADATVPGISLTKTASKTTVDIGETFEYTIMYQADGATKVGSDISISDTVPSQFEILDGWVDGGWDNKNGQTLTINTVKLTAGTSVILKVPVKAKATGINAPVSTTNKVALTVEGTNEVAEASAEVTINADTSATPAPSPSATPGPSSTPAPTYDKWEAYKNQNTGLGSVPIIGGEVTYTVGIAGTAGNTDRGSLENIVFEDTLPSGATFVSATQNGTHAGGKITWHIDKLDSGQSFEAQVKVSYPDDYGYGFDASAPREQKNIVDITNFDLTGGGSVTKDEADATTKFGKPVSGNPGLTKSREFQYRWHGQEQTFNIGGISNNGSNVNAPLRNLVLTDTLPSEMNYTSIKLPNRAWQQFRYEVSDGATSVWRTYSGAALKDETISVGASGSSNPARDIVLGSGEYLKALEWTFQTLPVGGSIGGIVVKGTVRAKANGTDADIVHGDIVTNHVSLAYEALNATIPGQWDTQTPKTASASFNINNEKPWITTSKAVGSGNFRPMSTVPFTLTVRNDIKATGPLINPVIYDLLPASFSYYTNPKIVDPAAALLDSYKLENAPSGVAKPSAAIVSTNFNGTGRTLVKWYWDAPVQFAPNTSFQITYRGQVDAGTPQGSNYRNEMFVTLADAAKEFWHDGDNGQDNPESLPAWQLRNTPIKDTTLLFNPTPGVDEFFVKASADVIVRKSSQVQSTKWNQGELAPIFRTTAGEDYDGTPALPVQPFDSAGDIPYTEFPYYSVTYEGGTADYRLAIRNTGNTRLGKIDLLDILPHIGDDALRVTSGASFEARGSEWQPNLAEVLESGNKTFTSSASAGSKKVDYHLNAYYSKSFNQDTVVNFDNATGAAKLGWVAQSSYDKDDLTDIKSLYFEITNIKGSDGSDGLAPGDYIVLDWKMNAPVGTPTNKIAWNSFSIQATEQGTNGSAEGSKMLPTAPNKVGFVIDPDDKHVPLGEIGNFVWFDSDKDGTQNEEYPGDSGQGAGINGITVNLYKGGNLTTPYKSSKTGYDYEGRPGYYLFQGLELDDYYVEFVVPEHYLPTIAGIGTGAIDSNPTTALAKDSEGYTPYRTDKITISAGHLKDHTIDFGLIEANPPGNEERPNAELTKQITSVTQGAAAQAASSDYVISGNQVHYTITFENKSSVTLHNIRLADKLDRGQNGFAFTKLVYDGEDIALSGNTHGRPDIVSSLNNTGSLEQPGITIRSLAPGKIILLEGQYSLTAADIDGTDLDNVVTAYYNELPGAEPLTDDTSIPTAGIAIKKTSSALSVQDTAAGKWIDYVVTVTNTGSYDLTNIAMADSKVSGIPAIPSLKAGESRPISYAYQLTASDTGGANVRNTASADPAEIPPVSTTHELPVITAPRGSIGDYVWMDRNEDGVQDDSEAGINGITVKLLNSNKEVITETRTRTEAGKQGYYLFQGLPEADYYVQFVVPADYSVTLPESAGAAKHEDSNATDSEGITDLIEIGPNAGEVWDDPTIDLGLIPRGEIGNYVWLDRNRDGIQNEQDKDGLNGITVRLYKNSPTGELVETTTTANDASGKPGYYLFDDLIAGDYYVQFVVPDDYTKTGEEEGTDPAKDSNKTNSSGFTDKIVIGPTAGWSEPEPDPGWVNHTIDLGLVGKGSIGNYVWFDFNGNGKQDEEEHFGRNGFLVKLYDKDLLLLSETFTADDKDGKPGYYLFEHLTAGDYYVQFIVPGAFLLTRPEASGVNPDEDSNKLNGGYTEKITIGETAPSGWKDLTIDIGLVYAPVTYLPTPAPTPTPTGPAASPTPTPIIPGGTAAPGASTTPASPAPTPTPTTPGSSAPPAQQEETRQNTPVGGTVDVPDNGKPSIGQPPQNGKVSITPDGKWVYTPDAGFIGKDKFSIIVTDEEGNEEEIWIEVDVELPLGGVGLSPDVNTLPKTGQESYLMSQLIGLCLFIVGMTLRKRSRKL